jgi:cytochrome b6-f complex subunit 4
MTKLDRQSSSINLKPIPTVAPPPLRSQWQWLYDILYLFPTVGLGTIAMCIGLAVLSPVSVGTPADPFATPEHLLPEWYLLPVYQLVRLVPYKIVGIITMAAFATGLLLLPLIENLAWFDGRWRRSLSIAIFSFSTIVTLWLGFGARLPLDRAFTLGLF